MPDQPPKKSGGLTRKVGPLPLWAWLAGGLVLAYVGYRFLTGSSGSSGPSQQTQTVASQTPPDATGLTTSAGAPADNGQTTQDFLGALGVENSSLLQALEAQNQDVLALAQSQLAAAQGNPAISPSSTSETQPATSTQPGGPNAPMIFYVSPQAVVPTSSKPAAATVVKPAKQPVSARYFTYKRDVPLGPGQTVHFQSGRGYYAA
jgi:hypothetical protein